MQNDSNRRSIGSRYEDIAASYMEEKGYFIAARNFSCRFGEIDIIACRKSENDPAVREYVFIEVKYRKTGRSGAGADAVSYQKQRKICRTADYYRMIKNLPEYFGYRFDVISIDGENIRHYENAFLYTG